MTNVDIDLTKFKAAVIWQSLMPEVRDIFEHLYAKYPADVLGELSGGATTDAGGAATLAEWIGDTENSPFQRYPMPSVMGMPTWSPHHPDPDTAVELYWKEQNYGADLGAYTDRIEIRRGDELILTQALDCDGLAQNATAERAVAFNVGEAGEYTVIVIVNEDGINPGEGDPTAQGFQGGTSIRFRVGGADQAPQAPEGEDFRTYELMNQANEAMTSMSYFMAADGPSVTASQQFGAALYYLSYVVNALPEYVANEGLVDLARQLYNLGDGFSSSTRFDGEADRRDPAWRAMQEAAQRVFGEIQSLIGLITGMTGTEADARRAAQACQQSIEAVLEQVRPLSW